MSRSSGFENNRFYESERNNTVLTHADFATDADFENLEESEDFVNFLLSKNYDQYFSIKRNNQTVIDTGIANKLFYTCYGKFQSKLDAVQIFHIITDFYNVEPTYFFWLLVKRLRGLLITDLKLRIDMRDERKIKFDATHFQTGFTVANDKPTFASDTLDDADG